MDKELTVGSYTRTITQRPVPYTCQQCGREDVHMQYPGARRWYCDSCREVVALDKADKDRERAAERMRRLREERRKAQQTS